MNWGAPWWQLGLVPVLVLALVVGFTTVRHRRRLREAFGDVMSARVLPRRVRLRRNLRYGMVLAGLALCMIALAQPRLDKQIQTVRARGVDIVVLLDLSRSMDAQDVEPSRLERAKREVFDLLRVVEGDRLGVVVYAGGAFVRLPLSEDLQAVRLVVGESDTQTFQVQGSALGEAIRRGVELLQRSEGSAGQALLVLSDGEVHDPEDAYAAASAAADAGVVVYALGIGRTGAPIPDPRTGWLEWEGQRVVTTPDATVMREIARQTGGAYVQSVASSEDITRLYRSEMRTKLVAAEREGIQRETWRAMYQWPLGLGVLLLLMGAWLGDGRRTLQTLAGVGLALLMVGHPGVASAGTLAEADELYRTNRFQEAADAFTELSLESPDDPGLLRRLGAARYRSGDFEGAARAWDLASELTGSATDAYNAGNAHWDAGRLEQAAERYTRVLEADPEHADAKHNSDLVAQEIALRRQPPPPPPPESGDGEEQDQQDGGDQQEQDQGGPVPEGDSEEDQSGDSEAEASNPSQPEDGEQSDAPSSLDDLQPMEDGETVEGQSATDMGPEAGEPITAAQADRLLESIEEGSQKVRVNGRGGDKPW